MNLLNGDCLEILKTLPDNSVDSLVTDPPAGISFMGKEWDSSKGGREEWISWMSEVMRECLRVLKPGAHGLVWAIPRTSHWTATALEDAGFEVRDVITHLFGQGFPKSLDISKAIDKAAGAEREVVVGKYRSPEGTSGESPGTAWFNGGGLADITAPATNAEKQWSGWGTALKPASENWILVRKPCSEKTVASNVVKWGTGGINIDGCRIPSVGKEPNSRKQKGGSKGFWNNGSADTGEWTGSIGRFPANIVLSHTLFCTDDQCDIECAIKALDEQSGIRAAGNHPAKRSGMDGGEGTRGERIPTDSGGASRFFYCAKISPSERGDGNNHPTVKPQKLMRYFIKMITPPEGIVLDPFMGSGSTGIAAKLEGYGFIGIEKDPEYFEIAQKRCSPKQDER